MSKLLTCSDDKTIKIWDIGKYAIIKELHGHQNAVRAAVFSRNDLNILSCSRDSTIKIWNIHSGLVTLEFQQSIVESALFNHNESEVISCGFKSICVWDVLTGKLK